MKKTSPLSRAFFVPESPNVPASFFFDCSNRAKNALPLFCLSSATLIYYDLRNCLKTFSFLLLAYLAILSLVFRLLSLFCSAAPVPVAAKYSPRAAQEL